MKLREVRHWVFDMDGTLTVAVHDFAAIRRALEIPAEADILTHLAGLPVAEAAAKHAWLLEHERELACAAQPAALRPSSFWYAASMNCAMSLGVAGGGGGGVPGSAAAAK